MDFCFYDTNCFIKTPMKNDTRNIIKVNRVKLKETFYPVRLLCKHVKCYLHVKITLIRSTHMPTLECLPINYTITELIKTP